jgi:hypothetical protein
MLCIFIPTSVGTAVNSTVNRHRQFPTHVGQEPTGHQRMDMINLFSTHITAVLQVDGHELESACNILGRDLPTQRVFWFSGNDAITIVNNWN